MKLYRADLHIHTVLSPCGDLEMSPGRIVEKALQKGLDIIGITDHNTTRHAELARRIGEKKGLFVLTGAEVTTKEEVHCLVFFENNDTLKCFQEFIDENLPEIKNNSAFFGYQVEVDEDENIVYEEKRLLTSALNSRLSDIETITHSLGGIFIPAHADRKSNSIYSQLGMLPPDMKADALELSRLCRPEGFIKEHPEISSIGWIQSSDAHFIDDIGAAELLIMIDKPSFAEIKMALHGIKGRYIHVR